MRNSIYLSGWEYNRVIADDPLAPVVSGLPAQVLWDGAAPFWLFETVYCTREALAGDIAAYHALGWTTGRMFEDLCRRGFLTPVNWAEASDKDPTLRSDLQAAHALLRSYYSPTTIRDLLDAGQDSELEAIKLKLLSPFLRRLHCLKNVSPNSITHWFEPDRSIPEPTATATAGALLAEAVMRSRGELRAGFRLCDPPGTGLAQEILERQRTAEQTVQKPLIPALLAGELAQDEFHRLVAVARDVYGPINSQLWASYVRNIDSLERLRDLARLHLWPKLHNEWLPAIEADPAYLPKFQTLLADAVKRAEFDPFLQFTTDVAIIAVSGVVGAAAAPLVGGDPTTAGIATAAIVGAAKRGFDLLHDQLRKGTESLAVFVQKARKMLRKDRK